MMLKGDLGVSKLGLNAPDSSHILYKRSSYSPGWYAFGIDDSMAEVYPNWPPDSRVGERGYLDKTLMVCYNGVQDYENKKEIYARQIRRRTNFTGEISIGGKLGISRGNRCV